MKENVYFSILFFTRLNETNFESQKLSAKHQIELISKHLSCITEVPNFGL
jgi:hypothetical protein